MRAFNFLESTPKESVGDTAATATPKNGTVTYGRGWTITTFLLAVAMLYLVWDWFVLKNKKIEETISPSNIRANLYNILMITFAAVIGINLFKVIFVKIAAWEIPGISWVAEKFVVLFQL